MLCAVVEGAVEVNCVDEAVCSVVGVNIGVPVVSVILVEGCVVCVNIVIVAVVVAIVVLISVV